MLKLDDAMGPRVNVRIRAYEGDKLVDERESHNILTNVGRKWFRDICRILNTAGIQANGFVETTTNAETNERPAYIGLGVGGLLTSDATTYYGTQEELVTVTALEDYVMYDATDYLKLVEAQTDGSDGVPTDYSIRFITTVLESEISFVGSTTKSGVAVGTSVPITEAALYLSGANPLASPDNATNTTRCIAYNIFDPIVVNPNIVLSVEWEFRF